MATLTRTSITGGLAALSLGAGLLIAPVTSSAAESPQIGGACTAKQAWKEVRGRASLTVDSKSGASRTTFVAAKRGNKKDRDRLVCVPSLWTPEPNLDYASPGSWQLVTWPDVQQWANVDVKSSLYEITPELEPCTSRASSPSSATSLSHFDRTARGLVPSVGSVRGLIVDLLPESIDSLPSRAAIDSWRSETASSIEFVEDYFQQASRNRMDLTLEVAPGGPFIQRSGVGDAATIRYLDADVDFAGYDFVVLHTWPDYSQRPSTRRSYARPAEPRTFVVDGESINNYTRLFSSPENGARREITLVHEIGHLLGLPDLYAESSPDYQVQNHLSNRFSGGVSLMESGIEYGFSGWERWILGWLPTDEVRCFSKPTSGQVDLDFRALGDSRFPGTLSMVVFKDQGDSDRHLVMELRAPLNGEVGVFPEPAFLTYEVNTRVPSARTVGLEGEQSPSVAPLVVWRDDQSTLDRLPLQLNRNDADFEDQVESVNDLKANLQALLADQANFRTGRYPTQPRVDLTIGDLQTTWEVDFRDPTALCGAFACAVGAMSITYQP